VPAHLGSPGQNPDGYKTVVVVVVNVLKWQVNLPPTCQLAEWSIAKGEVFLPTSRVTHFSSDLLTTAYNRFLTMSTAHV